MAPPETNTGLTRLVVVDPRLDDYRCLAELVKSDQLRLTLTTNGASALRLVPSFADAVWLICPQLPDMSGLDLLEMLLSINARLHSVVIDNEYDQRRELAALRGRAVQYVCKPMHAAWLESWRPTVSPAVPINSPHGVPTSMVRASTSLP